MRWVQGSRSTSCAATCRAQSRRCSAPALKTATLESNCATLMNLIPGKSCISCGPSDSTNKYCFPGTVAGYIYKHSSYNSQRGFTCDTIPDQRVTPWCPCITGEGTLARDMQCGLARRHTLISSHTSSSDLTCTCCLANCPNICFFDRTRTHGQLQQDCSLDFNDEPTSAHCSLLSDTCP